MKHPGVTAKNLMEEQAIFSLNHQASIMTLRKMLRDKMATNKKLIVMINTPTKTMMMMMKKKRRRRTQKALIAAINSKVFLTKLMTPA